MEGGKESGGRIELVRAIRSAVILMELYEEYMFDDETVTIWRHLLIVRTVMNYFNRTLNTPTSGSAKEEFVAHLYVKPVTVTVRPCGLDLEVLKGGLGCPRPPVQKGP